MWAYVRERAHHSTATDNTQVYSQIRCDRNAVGGVSTVSQCALRIIGNAPPLIVWGDVRREHWWQSQHFTFTTQNACTIAKGRSEKQQKESTEKRMENDDKSGDWKSKPQYLCSSQINIYSLCRCECVCENAFNFILKMRKIQPINCRHIYAHARRKIVHTHIYERHDYKTNNVNTSSYTYTHIHIHTQQHIHREIHSHARNLYYTVINTDEDKKDDGDDINHFLGGSFFMAQNFPLNMCMR